MAAGGGFLRPARPKAERQRKRDASKKFMCKENSRGTSARSVMLGTAFISGARPATRPCGEKRYQMFNPVRSTEGQIILTFKGIYARVAQRLRVDPSLVSRVASGSRSSPAIEKELRSELIALKEELVRRYG